MGVEFVAQHTVGVAQNVTSAALKIFNSSKLKAYVGATHWVAAYVDFDV